MNTWNISGEVLKHGIKGQKYPKLWVHVLLSNPKESPIQKNKVFVNFDLDVNPNSSNGKIGEFIKARLETNKFFFIADAMIATIPSSHKKEDGTWETEDIIGVKGKLKNFALSTERFDDINLGLVRGNVSKWSFTEETHEEKFIIEERYLNPRENKWKTRQIPILNGPIAAVNLTGKSVFVQASLCGVTPQGESKVYGWTKKLIVI